MLPKLNLFCITRSDVVTEKNTNILSPILVEGPNPHYQATTSRSEDNKKGIIYKTPTKVIPIVFLPGVMGSNLMSSDSGQPIWTVNSRGSVAKWAIRGPKIRKKLLNPLSTEVDSKGIVEKETHSENGFFNSRVSRGWGEVGAMSYGTFLPWLQDALNDSETLIENRIAGNVKKTLRAKLIDGIERNDIKGFKLTENEVSLSYKFLYPVHAVGYNWLQSNAKSALRLKNQVERIISDYNLAGLKCEKVIIVTHSMGGLVARYYSELMGGRENILGIVHGVIPNLGSPIAYKRMKTGEAGIPGYVIGSNGAEMTAVLAQSAGPLQLLPGTHYGNGWLQVEGMKAALPKDGNPYDEIYLKRSEWWGLCEERFLNPDNKGMDKEQLDSDWTSFDLLMSSTVKSFIEQLNGHYHPNTFSFYGNDGGKYPSYGKLNWRNTTKNNIPSQFGEETAQLGRIFYPPDRYNQTVRFAAYVPDEGKTVIKEFTLSSPTDDGDGTVPVRAATIASTNLQMQVGLSVDHEGAYKEQDDEGNIDSRWFTLWSIIKITQKTQETGLAYEE